MQRVLSLLAMALCLSPCGAAPQSTAPSSQSPQAASASFDCAMPVWPPGALDAQKTGTVTLALLIGADGTVRQSKIVASSGHADLDQAARQGISLCHFRPGEVHGKPAAAWMQMQYVWKLP
jgi:bla regulator protein BlaR1